MADPGVVRAIRYYARREGVDPRAALAIAMVEGGARRGARGDFMGGRYTSFGPFQLHEGGALPRGKAPGWAGSDAGIAYAIHQMATHGARGLKGQAAVAAISRNFERPADPGAEIRKALGYYGGAGSLQGAGGIPSGAPGGIGLDSGGPAPVDNKQALLQYVMAQNNAYTAGMPGIVSPLSFMQGAQSGPTSPSAPVSGPAGVSGAPYKGKIQFEGSVQGEKPEFLNKLSAAIAAIGGTKVRITSGYRSPAENRRVGGASNSNHMYGRAMDGEVYIPKRGWVPLGIAVRGIASRFGLRSGATFDWGGKPDVVHVDDGYNQR